MARKNTPAQPLLNARVENPFIHVPFQPGDLSSIEGGGGGGGKELVEVNAAYRQALSRTLADASSALSREQVLHPQALTHLVLKLREKGIAKPTAPSWSQRKRSYSRLAMVRLTRCSLGPLPTVWTCLIV